MATEMLNEHYFLIFNLITVVLFLAFFFASRKHGGSCSCSRSILRNSSIDKRLDGVSLKSPNLNQDKQGTLFSSQSKCATSHIFAVIDTDKI